MPRLDGDAAQAMQFLLAGAEDESVPAGRAAQVPIHGLLIGHGSGSNLFATG